MGDRPEKSLRRRRGEERCRRGDEGPPPRGRAPLEVATRCVRAFLSRLGAFGPAGQEPGHVGAFKLDPIFFPPANVKLTGMVKGYNGETFQWYFSAVQSFNGSFLKIGFFNGTELIFPFEIVSSANER